MEDRETGARAPSAGTPQQEPEAGNGPTAEKTRQDTASPRAPARGDVGHRAAGGSDAVAVGTALDRSPPGGDRRSHTPSSDPSGGDLSPGKNGKRRRRRRRGARSARNGAAALSDASPPGPAPLADAATGEGGAPDAPSDARAPKRSKSRKRRQRAKRARALRNPAVDGAGEAGGANGCASDRPGRSSGGAAASAPPQGTNGAAGNPASRQARGDSPFYAALDLGTNNCRLLVAAPTRPGQFRVVDAFSRIVRLGEGLAATGRLSEAAMDRAVDALRICASKLADKPIRKARLIATEACRAAENGGAFLERVRRETGLDLEIVDRETEARLAVSGCSSLVERETDSVVLFDIGGGSSEIAVIELPQNRSGRLANHIRAWTSLPVGVVTLSERFGGRDVTRDIFAAMVADVETMLESFLCPQLRGMAGEAETGRFHLIGTSGTVTTLAGVHLDLPRYDRRRVDGLWLTSDEVDRMLEKILSWDFDQRSANPCIGADRADLVLAGCAILEGIRRRWPAERMRVADRGLREGLLTDMMAADGVWRRRRSRFPASDRGRYRHETVSHSKDRG
ncbi:Ppx/GppA phosphatase family protein [Pararhizobium haloflavum]|uniref:Ppx/GppA phosphatase family protein n=1 Tax=Pararhizobium haloflavum TaxID=2037914 RepID=UPI000C17D3F1|nr:exopolyphosphatase [Pararhizobium haloflavum]